MLKCFKMIMYLALLIKITCVIYHQLCDGLYLFVWNIQCFNINVSFAKRDDVIYR